MANTAERDVGAVVDLTAPGDGGNKWTARQVDVGRKPPTGDPKDSVKVDWSFGPVKILGNVNTNTYELGVSAILLGINVGDIHGDLKDGVRLDINLFAAEGDIRFYLKNGNELWIRLDIKILFDGIFSGDYRILRL
ncbi:hypothetical protein QBC33DRAFT_27062 [Phialemonium atrogriseum]|uniref:Uncharacterized protein n=1 Tax=Phialemonium atrogriseum TaxID=1093897 RepID=A0AAJ0CE72_9PEZI|nr:uncharacterized protein QBC33DRAFT_27062 [Phialemonium atrogriseum]KAK1772686.1 hypothetical protein QBC33DRAFT_27062 [Phialemonium atrogriseum]